MLLERATGLADEINRYEKLKAAASQAKMLRTRAEQFRQAGTSLADARTILERFDAAGISVNFIASNSDDLIEKAGKLKDLVRADPTVLADPPFDLKYAFIDRLLGISTFAADVVGKAWSSYVVLHGPTGSSEVLDALAKLPQFQLSIARIRKSRQGIEELSKRTPTDPLNDIEHLDELVAEHRAAWSELKADGIPNSVIVFLRACGDNGALLSELTDEVRKWLETRDLLNAFRVRIG